MDIAAPSSVRSVGRPETLPRPVVELPATARALEAPGREHSNSVEFVQAGEPEENALTVALRELAARILGAFGTEKGKDGGGSPVTAEQLEFGFAAEVRAEALVQFRYRTAELAEGLSGSRGGNLAEVSRQVAARFEFSVSVSASVLYGFADGAEALGDEPDLDEFLELTRKLLGELDEVLNAFFEDVSGLFTLGEDSQRFLDELTQAYAGSQGARGQQVSFSSAQLEFEFSLSVSVEATVQESDPIVLDLDGDGVELTSFRDGALFDITASGQIVRTAFVTGGDAFLALDRNGNGTIDNGAELFGDQRGAANGFEELRKLDGNSDNRIDRRDTAYELLRLFRDNGNGQTEAGELPTLAQAGIESIALDYLETDQRAAGGNRIAQVATFTRADGRQGTAADAILNYLA